jgi:molecular chaperone DnaK (HSP70)
MRGRLAVDFGTSNTVLACWNEGSEEGETISLAPVSRLVHEKEERVSLIPSLIHYGEDGAARIGHEVVAQNLERSSRTFRCMKRYVGTRSPTLRRVGDREISPAVAGADFLRGVLARATDALGLGEEEIALTVPVETFEHYDHWLSTVAEEAGFRRLRLVDEACAAAVGYRAQVSPGRPWLVFDFGGGTLDVAVLILEGERCRVLGKAGAEIGGLTIDQWLFAEVLRRHGRLDTDDDVRRVSRALLGECERVKEALSSRDQAHLSVVDPLTGTALCTEFTRSELEDVLERNELHATVTRTVGRALAAAQERGYREEDLEAVLLVGGSSMIPSVGRTVRHLFGRDRVRLDRPLDAVARGAAALLAGLDLSDHVQHDYALRFVNPERSGYDYRILVPRGTPYPSKGSIAEMTVKATAHLQTHLGLAIFEVGEARGGGVALARELVFDPSGRPRIQEVGAEQREARTRFWMNQQNPTFLRADPPADKGEARFRLRFSIDANKRLLISAIDLRTGARPLVEHPVIRLT